MGTRRGSNPPPSGATPRRQFLLGEGYRWNYDERRALRWYRLAADQGHAGAMFKFGEMYADGRGVAQDDREAVRWYRRAADRVSADAMFKLGEMYADGRGVPQDDREAARWYRRATEHQGPAEAQFKLGEMYADGRGVPQDDSEAVRWYRRAADQMFFVGDDGGSSSARCTPTAGAYLRTTVKPPGGIAAPLTGSTPKHSSSSARCVPRAGACHRTTVRPSGGTAKQPIRGMGTHRRDSTTFCEECATRSATHQRLRSDSFSSASAARREPHYRGSAARPRCRAGPGFRPRLEPQALRRKTCLRGERHGDRCRPRWWR